MSTQIDSETNGITFEWKIVNISHCWLKFNEEMESPVFIADALEGTKWKLRLYPSRRENIILFLYRTTDCSGPVKMNVNYRLGIMDKDGEIVMPSAPSKGVDFSKDDFSTQNNFIRENIFVNERARFLHDDTLTICCSIWKKEEALLKSKQVSARTIFKVNRRSFVWKIEEFSNLKTGMRNKLKDHLLELDLVLKEGMDLEKKLVINCISIDKSIKYFSFKISIIDSEGEKEECGTHEYFENDLQKGIFSTLLSAKKVLENKSLYLRDDALTLECECVYSTGTILDQYCVGGIIHSKAKKAEVDKRNEFPLGKEKPQHALALVNDFKSLYNDGDFSDTELRTSTKTFPAHRNILSARSPVFKRMFSNDMRENNVGHIDIDDLEDDTVHRMLLYMYTDSLEDLQFENACKLYVAADKYEILSLRNLCSSLLKDNLCPTKACDILVLSDRHQDEDLKSSAQDFILRHNEVFGFDEWKHLMATNLQLAADVMYRKVYPA